MNKKAYFFSVDALVAFVIVLGVFLIVKPTIQPVVYEVRMQDDLLKVLSNIEIGELNNSYALALIANGSITNLNNSVLEQLGEFYAFSDSQGGNLVESIFSDLDLDSGLALYFDGNLVGNSSEVNFSAARTIKTSRQIISGIGGGVNASSGFSSRALLFLENKIKYFYFGGYVGDGNITMNIGDNVSSVTVEGDFSGDFDVYINGLYANSYTPTPGVPENLDLLAYSGMFLSGANNVSFRSNNGTLGIAGGYLRVVYNHSDFEAQEKHFPGISGFINLYDSFYVPGNLSSMNVFLHYNSIYDVFVSLGDDIIYTGNSNGSDITVSLPDSNLSTIFDYSTLSQTTVPLRVGFVNVSEVYRSSDVFSSSDISGSMNENEIECGGSNKLIDCAKDANREFITILLDAEQLSVGLIGYEKDAYDSDYHGLSRNESSLNDTITSWSPGGGSCICCGINRAVDDFLANSTSSIQSIVVMGDGKPNTKCTRQNTGSASGDAVQAACDAYNDHGIIVYSIGFGSGLIESVMQDIASCGQGDYYYGTVSNLVDVYTTIAENILEGSYDEQAIIADGTGAVLYPDSKISFSYDSDTPYGLRIVSETADFANNVSSGNVSIPEDSIPYDVGVVSYSGSKWTNLVEVYNNVTGLWDVVFNLSTYNEPYVSLGDPYIVNIPVNKIVTGENSMRVSLGANSSDSSGGSPYNKIVYSIIKNFSAYSPILPIAEGCIWHIEFEDLTNETMIFPSTYNGSNDCYFAQDDYFFPGDNIILGNTNDAINIAILNLLIILDLNSNNKIETKFSDSDMSFNSIEIAGLPFTFETEVQARSWR